MTRRTIAAFTGAVVLLAGTLLLSEQRHVSPGDLARGHADLKDNCRACHTPFVGAGPGCAACHGSLPAMNKHAKSHLACTSCHQEHRGVQVKLVTHAGADCASCHAHPSITAVKPHQRELIERPLEETPHTLKYSHHGHFSDIQDKIDAGEMSGESRDCARCHAERAPEGKGTAEAEHMLLWSGCAPCHEQHRNWQEAGVPDVPPDTPEVPFARFITAARLPRIRFRHSAGHLRTPCRECHVGIEEAKAIRLPSGASAAALPPGVAAAKRVKNCFGCHTHSPEGAAAPLQNAALLDTAGAAAADVRINTCAACHQFHGTGAHGDFPDGPKDEPRARPWDVWTRIAGFSITPWLLAFLGCGAVGYIALLRRFPADAPAAQQADPDVAPQRVSEVPALSPSRESSIPGVYIVGELAGVPLINRAMKSGFDAIDFIANKLQVDGRVEAEGVVDVLIAGAGPAGLGAGTRAKSIGLSYILCEKGGAAATIRGYPRAKVIQTAPIDIPEYGTLFQEDDESKEALVRRWQDIIARTRLVVNESEEVLRVARQPDGTLVTTVQGDKQYRSRFVVLALGVRGTPRRLGVEGETPDRVAYNLIDAEEFKQRRVMVVGGGNAACEAALALSAPSLLNEVTLSHRGPVLRDVTAQNSHAIDVALREGQLRVEPDSVFKEIRQSTVLIDTPSGPKEIANDFVFGMIGAELPTKFLRAIGVKLVRKGGL